MRWRRLGTPVGKAVTYEAAIKDRVELLPRSDGFLEGLSSEHFTDDADKAVTLEAAIENEVEPLPCSLGCAGGLASECFTDDADKAVTLQAAIENKVELLPCSVGCPEGLVLGRFTDDAMTSAARDELMPHFRTDGSRKSTSSMFEVGWSFLSLDSHGTFEAAKPLSAFPMLQRVLCSVILAISGCDDLDESRLNVICRHYAPGQGLKFHVDRPGMFYEHVFGCVLGNSSDRHLEFRRVGKSREVLSAFRLDEKPGICFRQSSDSRYRWIHGVEPIKSGERVSVTWRWLRNDAGTLGVREQDPSLHASSTWGETNARW